jgi:hypothetical protein
MPHSGPQLRTRRTVMHSWVQRAGRGAILGNNCWETTTKKVAMTRLASHVKRVRDPRATLVVIPGALLISGLVLFLLIASTADVSGQSGICSTSPDGSHVACGGQSGICSTSPDGSHVACGGESGICSTSPDGSHVACGGESGICSTSPDGSHVACGGKSGICSTSPDGSHVACGGGRPSLFDVVSLRTVSYRPAVGGFMYGETVTYDPCPPGN